MDLTMGSLFDGIGGFPLAFGRYGITPKWSVEINPDCGKVLNQHWPDLPKFLDVKDVGAHNLERVDVITGGTPCQGLSVAGRRAGLEDERSGLFYEFIRVCDELKPRMILWENVPGALSSNGGKDFQIVLESFAQLGYILDVDIKDAQFFGVPQRRRRIFITCVRSDDLLSKRTPFSERIVMDLTVQALLASWDAILQASSAEQLPSGYVPQIGGYRASPLERMRSLSDSLGKSPVRRLVEFWEGAPPVQSLSEWIDSALTGERDGLGPKSTTGATESSPPQTREGEESGSESTSKTPRSSSGASSKKARSSITSILTPSITTEQICTYVETVVSTLESISNSITWSKECWSAAGFGLTLAKELTSYARQASSELFSETSLRPRWRDCLDAASACEVEFERHTRTERAAQVLFESESGSGDPAAGGEARPELATDVAASLRGSSGGARRGWGSPDGENGLAVVNSVSTNPFQDRGDAGSNLIPTQAEQEDSGESDRDAGAVKAFAWQQGVERAVDKQGRGRSYIARAGDYTGALSASRQDAIYHPQEEDLARPLLANKNGNRYDGESDTFVIGFSSKDNGADAANEIAPTMRSMSYDQSHLNGGGQLAVCVTGETAHALSSEGSDASEDGTGRGTPIIPILEATARQGTKNDPRDGTGIGQAGDPMFSLQASKQHGIAFAENQRGEIKTGEIHPQLSTGGEKPGQGYPAVMTGPEEQPAIAFTERTRPDGRSLESQEDLAYALTNPGEGGRTDDRMIATPPESHQVFESRLARNGRGAPSDIVPPLKAQSGESGKGDAAPLLASYGVRRLTPMECERLQGFPDGHTAVDSDGVAISDSARYRMLGNSVAVPVVEFVARRMRLALEGIFDAD